MGKAAIQFDIERRMESEIEQVTAETGNGWDNPRKLEKVHKSWEKRFPEIYGPWNLRKQHEAIKVLDGLFDPDPTVSSKLRLIRD